MLRYESPHYSRPFETAVLLMLMLLHLLLFHLMQVCMLACLLKNKPPQMFKLHKVA